MSEQDTGWALWSETKRTYIIRRNGVAAWSEEPQETFEDYASAVAWRPDIQLLHKTKVIPVNMQQVSLVERSYFYQNMLRIRKAKDPPRPVQPQPEPPQHFVFNGRPPRPAPKPVPAPAFVPSPIDHEIVGYQQRLPRATKPSRGNGAVIRAEYNYHGERYDGDE